jgi:hypothetical protein
MSLQLAAQHLAAHGRGKDTELVHMDKGELHALRAMAQGAGGDLTVNPHTGLPEAGFLSSLLPTIAGFALNAAVPGLGEMTGLGQFAAPAIVGGASMLMGGSLQNGLMAGLGAYGGSQLASSLANAGTVTNAAQISAANTEAANTAAEAARQQAIEDAARNSMDIRPPPAVSPDVAAQSAREYYSNLGSPSAMTDASRFSNIQTGLSSAANSPMDFLKANKYALAAAAAPGIMGALPSAQSGAGTDKVAAMNTPVPQRYQYTPGVQIQPADVPMVNQMNRNFGSEVMNFQAPNMYTPINASQAKSIYGFASGGMLGRNPIEQMSNQNAIGANTGFPQAYIHNNAFATPTQTPVSQNVLTGPGDTGVDPYTGEQNMADGGITGGGGLDLHIPIDLGGGSGFGNAGVNGYSAVGSGSGNQTPFSGQNNTGANATGGNWTSPNKDPGYGFGMDTTSSDTFQGTGAFGGNPQQAMGLLSSLMQGKQTGNTSAQMANGGMATGGISDAHYNLGGYSDGGRLLRGPGDGVSDSIPATIGHKQPARLADGEFVVPARIVSELGNGSTEAGARKLYAMMDRVQAARKKTVGKNGVAHNSRADKYLPA